MTADAAVPPSRVAVVTGGSSGIGLATAVGFAEQGACVVLSARSGESLRRAEEACIAAGAGDTLVVVADVCDEVAVEAVASAAVARFGRIDVWVNTAAVIAYGRFEDVPSDVFRRVLDTNIHGTVHVARAALRQFRRQGSGTLVLLGSLLGEIATPYMGSYVTTKWAVRGLARVLAIETRRDRDIHVCVVSPGAVNTPIYLQAGSYTGHTGRPPPPVVSPEKVARAILRSADDPKPRRAVGPANALGRLGFTVLPPVYDAVVLPMLRLLGQQRGRIEPNSGNVLEPVPEREGARGSWAFSGRRSRR